ncbi:MAG: type II toxin-antitoxin system VapC family toxin [Sulfuricella sp.]|nr:type II toxin-antitoxin system VapC family toxin [Sulfuricella sp.]
MIYLDTSVLGALFFREPSAPTILSRLESAPGTALVISAWTLAEMASVGAIKERTGQIGAQDRAAGLAAFQRFVADTLNLVEVEPGDFRTAAPLLDLPTTTLRAADALHLSIAHRLRADLATLDRRQGMAANHYGIGLFPLS